MIWIVLWKAEYMGRFTGKKGEAAARVLSSEAYKNLLCYDDALDWWLWKILKSWFVGHRATFELARLSDAVIAEVKPFTQKQHFTSLKFGSAVFGAAFNSAEA